MMLPTVTPRPICMGLMPPRLPLGAAPALSVWFRMSVNTTTEVLNPGVAALAMLLPITSIHFWKLVSPDTPENSERDICLSLDRWVMWVRSGRPSDAAPRHRDFRSRTRPLCPMT